ncbi:mannan endo-1,6-alpha-mannosidase-1 [Coleophoma cylindrospora]|uniref:Mannan endo-1,6-alpha-mannosidase n=1 Tax=Coleophoma cylindrospora TaxID=1849047 RepID=A0A3D8QBQ8_9HELO|nr:mannan endo-1,6-alpha-mannosidase-1 [Coleophoma cylindrospora]
MWPSSPSVCALALALLLTTDGNIATALQLDLSSTDSIKSVASTIAYDMMTYYKGNLSGQIPGELPGPPPTPAITNEGYFWWETGAMFGSLMDYWYYTGDSTYNDVVTQGMLFQTGANNDYLPQNQTNGMGNDDQAFWGMAAMTAAELNFPNPPADKPQWLALVQAVYNTQVARFDNKCGGGLHWQAYPFLNGYNYKNSIANGCFFNIASRLALYTGNSSYADRAESTWDWVTGVGLIDQNYLVYDGTNSDDNCSSINHEQFSYNAAVFLLGAATMYNYTNGDPVWKGRVEGLLNSTINVFFPQGIGYEVTCEAVPSKCTIDMLSYKAYLVRWMAAATKLAPFIYDPVIAVIKTSAAAAVLQCSGSPSDHPNGRMCGLSWSKGTQWDGTSGVGQQMAALEVVQSNLIQQAKAPVTNSTGGTSQGDPTAGINDPSAQNPTAARPATKGDKVGAGFLTAVVSCVIIGGVAWLSIPG